MNAKTELRIPEGDFEFKLLTATQLLRLQGSHLECLKLYLKHLHHIRGSKVLLFSLFEG